ncbi:MAG: lytic transglycosylase domain-containing protein [Myxococcales bacterium]|nr:lytic transglycosylase domain-containing protein [Myxococcota bacterium]MDW8280179.1 lytic transglycosylase domain-containing protein [Myxococcales bacterium]
MTRLVLALLALTTPFAARGDVWSYEDKDGVVHFTNIPPRGKNAHLWRVVYRTGPGKAQTVSAVLRGAAGPSSYPGCRESRADVVPATDRSPDRYVRYDAYIAEAAATYSLPEPLIRAIIKAESDYDPRVVSCAGARGLMQIMPDVEREQHIRDVFDPRDNILGGSRLLRILANRFKGDLVLTIAGYHAGAGAVLKYGGVPPYETTQAYVRTVLRHYQRYKEKARLASL